MPENITGDDNSEVNLSYLNLLLTDNDTDHIVSTSDAANIDLDLRIERLFENQSCESLYRLRSSNWIPAQQLFKRAVTRLNLSSAEIRVTLEYFKQCVTRSKQMTNTYDDADATLSLLKEREDDIEMAATIGLELLDINTELRNKVDELTDDLNNSTELVSQLKHELENKQKFIESVYTDQTDDDDDNFKFDLKQKDLNSKKDIEHWKRKITYLHKENDELKMQFEILQQQTESCENKEKHLLKQYSNKLAAANSKLESLNRQLRKKSDECDEHKLRIQELIHQTGSLQNTVKRLTDENDELSERVQLAKELQNELEQQVITLNASYTECLDILDTSQKDVRHWQALSQWRVSFDELNDYEHIVSENETLFDCVSAAAAAVSEPSHYRRRNSLNWRRADSSDKCITPAHSDISSKFRICKLLNKKVNDSSNETQSNDLFTSSQITIADSGMHSDSDRESSFMDENAGQLEKRRPDLSANKSSIAPSADLHRYNKHKLILLKPIEGSTTLKRWKELASPGLANLLKPKLSGVFSRQTILKNSCMVPNT